MKKLFNNEKIDTKSLNEVIKLGSRILKVLFVLLVIVGIYAVTLIFKEWKILPFILLILKILSPFFIGIIIAWLLDPCVKFLHKRGINRVVGTSLVYIVMLLLLYLLITTIFPLLLGQLNDFIRVLPDVFSNVTDWLNNFIDRFENISFIDVEAIKTDVVASINSFVGSLTTDVPRTIVNFISGMFSTIGVIAVGLMIGFYLLFDFDNVGKVLMTMLPKRLRSDALSLFTDANDSVFNYIKGTFVVSIIIFILSSLVFTITGLQAPLLFGLICGITNVIPYIGPYLGAFPATLVAFTQDVATGIIVLVAIMVVQFVEGNFVQPLVMSKTMKLHPVTILIGLLLFGYFFGVVGMIIATPLIAVIKSVVLFIERKFEILKFNEEE
ncbi:MAG TPA: AI-2E family transporter [Mollicutes bacterium]|nr:AI-2E family transporter [Mollicutes bacterium]